VDEQADDFDLEERADRGYLRRDQLPPGGLSHALTTLQFLGDDPFLRMQAVNLDVVDQFLLDVEYDVLQRLHREERTPGQAHFLNAQSQMWIFAAYELLRTWTERAKDLIKWATNGGLEQKLEHLKGQQEDYMHFGRDIRIAQIEAMIATPELAQVLQAQLKHLHIPYERMTYIRVSLAKHQVSGKAKSIALNPGYGRINSWCGSLDYALESGRVHLGTISRRDIADSLRALSLDDEPPSDETLQSFDQFMKAF
jgi:hypothetical protein